MRGLTSAERDILRDIEGAVAPCSEACCASDDGLFEPDEQTLIFKLIARGLLDATTCGIDAEFDHYSLTHAATTAADAAAADNPYKPIFDASFDASFAARKAGGDWSACYAAARKVADGVVGDRIRERFVTVRDELDAGFQQLVRDMAAMTERSP